MIEDINKIIEEFEKLGYSHEEAINIVEPATTLSDEEIKRIADEFSRIGCTSFQLTPDEVHNLLEKTELETTVDDWKRLGYTDEEAEKLVEASKIYK